MTESQSLTSTSVDDHNLSFKRRRCGNTIYTWVYVESGEQWLSLGDPWPCATPAKAELLAAIHATLGIKPMTYKMIEDPGHGWLRVPLAEIVGLTFSKFYYADGEYAYLEEDCDAPKFLASLGNPQSTNPWQDIPTEYIENDCFVRRLGGLPSEFITEES